MSEYMQTAIEEALAAQSMAAPSLPFILAGPVVRRAEPDGVWFWFACSQEITACTPAVTVYDRNGKVDAKVATENGWLPLAPHTDLRVVRLGERLWVAMVKATPRRPFVRGVFYGYELSIGGPNFTTTVSNQRIDVAYPPFKLPTFTIANDAGQRLVHGSCRRPGAPGPDAYGAFDAWLKTPRTPLAGGSKYRIADATLRPSALLLTGDQIYADDVALPLFTAVQRLARALFGYVERLPRPDGRGTAPADDYTPPGRAPAPGALTRKALTALPGSPIGFTTDDGEAHLLSFAEFAAMYVLVHNEQLCRSYGVDDAKVAELRGFPSAVGACRRVLANMATYMVFDDHEITDDWNLDQAWVSATANPMARRIIANGLAAYWAFQGWGNDPEQFEPLKGAISGHLEALRRGGGEPSAPAAAFDRDLMARHWSFVAPTSPPALCVDTRTQREFPAGERAVLSGPKVWPYLTSLQRRHQLRKGAPLLLVLPTPLLAHRSMTFIQRMMYPWPSKRYEGDWELYINNPRQRADLIRFLRSQFDPPSVVIFSGDVHHGSVIKGLYVGAPNRDTIDSRKGSWGMRIAQVTSSPIKNIKKDAYVDKKLIIIDAGNVGESVISQYETLYADYAEPRETIGVRADAVKLSGDLGRETFIWENHLCVVDFPTAAGGDVDVLFVGAKDGTFKTASGKVSTGNDPRTFEPSPKTQMMRARVPVLSVESQEAHWHPLGGQKPIDINSMDHLVTTIRALYAGVDAGTRAKLIRNNTVAVGWAVVDGDYRTVYTVSGDATYPSLRETADRLGLVRWQATPRTEGRGAVGAPGDAEQRMLEAAEANGSRVTKMVVSRPVCPDCREALRDYRRGSVDVREMPFRMPGPPSTSAKVAAMAPLVVQGVNIVLNYLIGGENADAIRAALDRIRPEIKAAQAARPTSGHLLIFRYRTAGEGVTPKFESVAQREGYTQDEAKERWANSPDYAREPENTFEFSWIPPVVQPPAVVLATPWPKVAIAQFADQSRLQFQKAQFSQLGGFGARGRTKTYDMHTLAKFQFAVLEIPKTLTYVNPADKLANKDVGVGQRDVAGGRLPVIMLDSDTPAVTVWPVDDLTHGLFTAAGKMGGRLDDKVGALRHHVGVDLVRWLPPEQVRAINML